MRPNGSSQPRRLSPRAPKPLRGPQSKGLSTVIQPSSEDLPCADSADSEANYWPLL